MNSKPIFAGLHWFNEPRQTMNQYWNNSFVSFIWSTSIGLHNEQQTHCLYYHIQPWLVHASGKGFNISATHLLCICKNIHIETMHVEHKKVCNKITKNNWRNILDSARESLEGQRRRQQHNIHSHHPQRSNVAKPFRIKRLKWHHRIGVASSFDGLLCKKQHFPCTSNWQTLESRLDCDYLGWRKTVFVVDTRALSRVWNHQVTARRRRRILKREGLFVFYLRFTIAGVEVAKM